MFLKRIIIKNSPFMELSFIKKPYTLHELQHSKEYNIIRKLIPYNEQYEIHDFKRKNNLNKDNEIKFTKWLKYL